jgi:hypothetical protein
MLLMHCTATANLFEVKMHALCLTVCLIRCVLDIFVHSTNVVTRVDGQNIYTYIMYNKYILPSFFQGQC